VPRTARFLLLLVAAAPQVAHAQIEGVRREEVDAGFHQPVVTKPPLLLEQAQAEYPPEAAEQKLTGNVKMRVTVAADGSVSDVQVTEGAGHGFDESATAAVKKFRFSPAEVDGAPSPIQIEYVYHFAFQAKAVEPKPEAPPKLATLKGQVIARGSRRRVAGATVRCGEAADAAEATTDEEGRFTLQTPGGVCEVRIVATDFQLFKTTEQLTAGETTEVNYYLLPKAFGNETVIHGDRDKKEVVKRTLDREELENVPGSFGDPIRVIQDLPGVARTPFGLGQLIIRGASPAETDTELDGVSIPILFHLGGGPSVVNPQFLDHIDFYPGGFGARYGRAIGGVVDVYTRRGAADTLHGEAKVDLLDADVFLEAPVAPGVSVAAAARRSYVDAILPLLLSNNLLVVPQYWDYQVRADFGPPKNQPLASGQSRVDVMAFGSNDVLKIISTGTGASLGRNFSVGLHTLFHVLEANWSYRWGNLTSVFTPYLNYTSLQFAVGSSTILAPDYLAGAREDLKLEATPWLTLRGGFDIVGDHLVGQASLPVIAGTQYPDYPGAAQQAQTQNIQMVINSFDPGLYAEADFRLGKLTVTPGLRFAYDREFGHDMTAWDPRLWLRYQLLERTALKGSIGLYSQPPASQDVINAPFGSPFLGEQHALQTSFGVEHKFTDVINIDVTGFFNRRYDLVVTGPFPVVNSDGSVTNYMYGNQGLGRAYGLEVLLRHEITKNFFGWIAYTLSRSEVRNVGQTSYYLSQYDQTHILTAIASYTFPFGVELGGRFRYVTGNPTTPVQHPYDLYDVDANAFSASYGGYRSARLPDFNQLDIRVDKYWRFTHWTLDTYLDVQNVYNAKNVEANFYDYRFRFRYDVPGIPFLPVLGVKGSF
jgi:TonB family protein